MAWTYENLQYIYMYKTYLYIYIYMLESRFPRAGLGLLSCYFGGVSADIIVQLPLLGYFPRQNCSGTTHTTRYDPNYPILYAAQHPKSINGPEISAHWI